MTSTTPTAAPTSINGSNPVPGMAYPFPPGQGAAGIPYSLSTSASLYVGELLPEVSEALLYELFNQIGPVASIRVCRDTVTRKSLGYGYINFHNLADAERALDALNYSPIKGHPCRLMWSQRDPSVRRSGNGNIFIKNLDKSVDNKTLHDTFSAFGNILSCKVVCDEHGSKGFGFVHFEKDESADFAIAKVNGMLLADKKVFVGRHVSRRERVSKFDEMKAKFTNVFAKNIDESVSDEDFVNMFSPFGKITSASLQKDEDGKSRGFGFVNFETHEDAQKAVDEMHNKEVNGKVMFVGRAQSKAEREDELRRQFEQLKLERINKYQGVNLYVKNLDESITEEKLKEEFSPFGQISSAKIMADDKGISKGFGFICFSSPEEAAKAVTEMNGRMIAGKPIYVAMAQRKDERKAQLEMQYAQRAQMRMQAGLPPMYPGGPVFYPPGAVPGQRPFMFPPQQMVARPRWMGPQIPGGQRPNMNYPAQSSYANATRPRPSRPSRGGMGGRKGGNPKYHSGARNAPEDADNGALTTSALASAAPEQQKQMLGERLYPLVRNREPELSSKITGMLLEMDNGELLHLLESPEALSAKVAEAVTVLHHHMSQLESEIENVD